MNIDTGKAVTIGYVNWQGKESLRKIVPLKLHFGTNEYYRVPQWIIEAWDCAKEAPRSFALLNIRHTKDVAEAWQNEAKVAAMSSGEKLAQELAQALVSGDEMAGQVAAVNIVGNVLDSLETIADAMKQQARCMADIVDYGKAINTNG